MRPAADTPLIMKVWRAHLEYLIRIASGDGTFKVIFVNQRICQWVCRYFRTAIYHLGKFGI